MAVERRSFTVRASGILRQLITPCFVSETSTIDGASPRSLSRRYRSLWDTGATLSMITIRVVEDLNLRTDGNITLRHAGGQAKGVPIFYVNLLLYNNVEITDLRVGLVDIRDSDVIIGMDIINRGDFAVSNRNGATSFSYRIPSVEDFDFAAADNISGPSGVAGNGEQ